MIKANDIRHVAWRESSYSSSNGGNCVEVGAGLVDAVPVRDSKNPSGPALVFPPSSWTLFISAVRGGEFHGV
ncbi:DUF397 domain-containing protein [Streptomyces hygroscopicus]|uniref:DUF397 domain-containing protein n=1 Tax=Streptomyces hygroscopicus TaxID=1912 RepID=UPI00099BAE12|nr:DUF397 domain-containing protein [Streptomyces hygroscopicus]